MHQILMINSECHQIHDGKLIYVVRETGVFGHDGVPIEDPH